MNFPFNFNSHRHLKWMEKKKFTHKRTRVQLYAIDIFSGLEMMSIVRYIVLFLDGRTRETCQTVSYVKKIVIASSTNSTKLPWYIRSNNLYIREWNSLWIRTYRIDAPMYFRSLVDVRIVRRSVIVRWMRSIRHHKPIFRLSLTTFILEFLCTVKWIY